jgi:hypothetical protein
MVEKSPLFLTLFRHREGAPRPWQSTFFNNLLDRRAFLRTLAMTGKSKGLPPKIKR